jgi:hypothetical protein
MPERSRIEPRCPKLENEQANCLSRLDIFAVIKPYGCIVRNGVRITRHPVQRLTKHRNPVAAAPPLNEQLLKAGPVNQMHIRVAGYFECSRLESDRGDEEAEVGTAIRDDTSETQNLALRDARSPALALTQVHCWRLRIGIRCLDIDLDATANCLDVTRNVSGEATLSEYVCDSFLKVAPISPRLAFNQHCRKLFDGGWLRATR